jgi:hypothetical protein
MKPGNKIFILGALPDLEETLSNLGSLTNSFLVWSANYLKSFYNKLLIIPLIGYLLSST